MLADATFCITTFGCQMNKYDSEKVAGMLEQLGAVPVASNEEADFCIFMTCCVREKADERLMGQVKSMKNLPLRKGSRYPKRYVAIGGCIGQRDGEKLLKQLKHVDVVFGTHNKEELPHMLEEAVEKGTRYAKIVDGRAEFHDDLPEDREAPWAAWLPISVGCNNFCTYCIVPYVRGREISRPFDEVVSTAQRYVDAGVREITLLGQNVNSYGRDLYGEPRFAQVLDAVAATGIERLRFLTSHPKDLNDEVIERFSMHDNIMPALHLALQSGSDRILRQMNRRYTAEHYLGLVEKLRRACPGIALSTDIIVGFPGESEQDFQATYDLVKEVGYSQVFTFIYSKREGTPAATMPDEVPREVVQERFDRLVELVQESAYRQNQREAGKVVPVLVEGSSKRDSSMLSGRSPRNQTVHASIPQGMNIEDLKGTILPVRIEEALTWYLKGKIIHEEIDTLHESADLHGEDTLRIATEYEGI